MSVGGFRVVTVGREYGSGGAAIAGALAERLGFRLLDRALIERIAAKANIDPGLAVRLDERVDSWAARVARSLRFGPFEVVSPVAGDAIFDAERLQALTAAVIEEAAAAGECVIVGRGAQCLLRARDAVFHVFVYAPAAERIRRLRARLGTGADVESLIDEVDRKRAAYVRRHFGCDWLDRRLYHLMVNAALGEGPAVDAILAALATRGPRPA
jgi:cytidylate kinase